MTDGSEWILLLDDHFDLRSVEGRDWGPYRAIIAFFWMAPATQSWLSRTLNAPCYGLAEIIRSDGHWSKEAYGLTMEVMKKGPQYKDHPWRSYLTEPLYLEAYRVHLLRMTGGFADGLREEWNLERLWVDGGLEETHAGLLLWSWKDYPKLGFKRLSPMIFAPKSPGLGTPFLARLGSRFREFRLTGDWRSQAYDAVEWLDKTCRFRVGLGNWLRHPKISPGGVTFFSSYRNNTRVLTHLLDSMPGPVNWVLTNESARSGLSPGEGSYSWLWQYGSPSISGLEVKEEGEDGGDPWLDHSRAFQAWKSSEGALLSRLTQCWEAYLDGARPRLVAFANQWGIEGWFAQIARGRRIPVLQVMHGALGGHLYTRTPILSDGLVVPGEFWKRMWPLEERKKILVYNPPGFLAPVERRRPARPRSLTFFSWPLSLSPFYNYSALVDEFIRIFRCLLEEGKSTITVRAHPRENPSEFIRRWRRYGGGLPPNLRVSKTEPLEEVLAGTDVALMFRSTVMMNCLASGIPVILPGWIDFGWNRDLTGLPGVFLAGDLPDLEWQIRAWLENPPEKKGETCEYFVRSPGEGREDLKGFLRTLMAEAL